MAPKAEGAEVAPNAEGFWPNGEVELCVPKGLGPGGALTAKAVVPNALELVDGAPKILLGASVLGVLAIDMLADAGGVTAAPNGDEEGAELPDPKVDEVNDTGAAATNAGAAEGEAALDANGESIESDGEANALFSPVLPNDAKPPLAEGLPKGLAAGVRLLPPNAGLPKAD